MAPPHLRGHNVAEVQKKEFVCTGRLSDSLSACCVTVENPSLALSLVLFSLTVFLLMLFKTGTKVSIHLPLHGLALAPPVRQTRTHLRTAPCASVLSALFLYLHVLH